MQTNVSQRLMTALEKGQAKHRALRARASDQMPPWLEHAWKLLTLDLGHWLIAHAPRERVTPALDAIDVASADSFPASDPPAWIGSRNDHDPS